MNKMIEGSCIGVNLTKENELDEVLQTLADKEDDWEIKRERVSVTDIDLKSLYMKIQKKTALASEQRIEDGIVHFTVNANVVQIAKVRAYVQHYMDWIIDEGMMFGTSEKGRSELETKVVGQKMTDYYYVTDLDSVYCTEQGKKVYELNKNHGENMNNWVLFIKVELIDQTTDEFFFGPFRLKTKPVKKSREKPRSE